jgi:hypothetical protein
MPQRSNSILLLLLAFLFTVGAIPELVLTRRPSKFVEQHAQRQYTEQEDCRTQNRCCDAETTLKNEPSNIASVERLLPPGPDKYRANER